MDKKIIDDLKTAKEFVEINGRRDTTKEIAEEIQGYLSEAIEAAENDDVDGVIAALDAIDKKAVPGWDLTSRIRDQL
ncbi:MAG: hypothetical protein WCH86_01705 [Kiritimatiellales bacterium]